VLPLQLRNPQSEVLVSARRVAEILQISPRTVRRMAESGQLAATKIGGQWRFAKSQVLGLLPQSNQTFTFP